MNPGDLIARYGHDPAVLVEQAYRLGVREGVEALVASIGTETILRDIRRQADVLNARAETSVRYFP